MNYSHANPKITAAQIDQCADTATPDEVGYGVYVLSSLGVVGAGPGDELTDPAAPLTPCVNTVEHLCQFQTRVAPPLEPKADPMVRNGACLRGPTLDGILAHKAPPVHQNSSACQPQRSRRTGWPTRRISSAGCAMLLILPGAL